MNNLKIRYLADGYVLCLNHAIHAAYLDVPVTTEVDDFYQEGDMRSTLCIWCLRGTSPFSFERLSRVGYE